MKVSDASEVLSREECETILRRHYDNKDFELLEYSVSPLSDSVVGFLGEHFIIKAQTKYENKTSVVSFFAKIQPDVMIDMSRDTGAFQNEICFYEKLVPEFKKYCGNSFDTCIIPRYYFSRDENIVVLENCKEKGFSVPDSDDILSLNQINLCLESIAKIHAASIIYEEKKSEELGKKFRLTDEYSEYLKEPFFRRGTGGVQFHEASVKCLEAIIDLMPELEISKKEFKEKIRKTAEDCFEIVKPTKHFRNVCCHGDLWRNNVLFRYENGIPVACKIIDFQLMKYNPPLYDVLKLLHQVTTVETRQRHLDDWLSFYYDHLCKNLKLSGVDSGQVIPYDQFQASYKYILPYVKMEGLYYYTFQRTGPNYINNLMQNKDAFMTYTYVDRTPSVKQLYTEGSYYKMWLDELLLEIKDLLIHDGISREDCHVILKKKLQCTDYEFVKYEVNKTGNTDEHKLLEITCKHNGETKSLKFRAKFVPGSPFNKIVICDSTSDLKFIFNYV